MQNNSTKACGRWVEEGIQSIKQKDKKAKLQETEFTNGVQNHEIKHSDLSCQFCESVLIRFVLFGFFLGSISLEWVLTFLTDITGSSDYSLSCRLRSLLRAEVRQDSAPIRPDLGGNEVYASLWCQLAGGPINESDHQRIHACACKIHVERMP